MNWDKEQNIVTFSIDELISINKQSIKQYYSYINLCNLDSGLEVMDGSWYRYFVVDKKKLMLFIIKYGLT